MTDVARDVPGILVGGRSVTSDIALPVDDPATLKVIRTVSAADGALVDAAVGAAADALTAWSTTAISTRQKALATLAASLRENADALARLLTSEQGKPLAEARREVFGAAAAYDYYATLPMEMRSVRDDEQALITVHREAVGVCALLLPWNYPVAIMAWKLAPCLLAGNTAVVKPAAYTPLTDGAIAAMAARLAPPGVVNLTSGGDEVGRALVGHPEVAKVSLTGSVETGRLVAEAAGRSLKRTSLELGGNDAAVVFSSVDPEKVASELLWSAMRNAGQVCVAVKRLYLHEDIAEAVIARMVDEASSITLGHGLAPGTQMGPVNNDPQLARIVSLVEGALDAGGTVLCGGGRVQVDGYEGGRFHAPTLITDLPENAPLVQEEQFGPALPVLTFSDEDEVLERVNATGYGLGASVWDKDIEHARSLASRIRAGTVWINTHVGINLQAPFGGRGMSGIGRELGPWGLDSYSEWKTFHLKRDTL